MATASHLVNNLSFHKNPTAPRVMQIRGRDLGHNVQGHHLTAVHSRLSTQKSATADAGTAYSRRRSQVGILRGHGADDSAGVIG